MTTRMNLSEARSAYSALSTRETLADLLATRGCWPIELDTSAFGDIALSMCACRALDLDGLFSARYLGVAVEQAIVDAMSAAAESAAPEDDLFFTVSFGRLGAVRLMARAMADYVQVFASPP
jgi:hypothetical protein